VLKDLRHHFSGSHLFPNDMPVVEFHHLRCAMAEEIRQFLGWDTGIRQNACCCLPKIVWCDFSCDACPVRNYLYLVPRYEVCFLGSGVVVGKGKLFGGKGCFFGGKKIFPVFLGRFVTVGDCPVGGGVSQRDDRSLCEKMWWELCRDAACFFLARFFGQSSEMPGFFVRCFLNAFTVPAATLAPQ